MTFADHNDGVRYSDHLLICVCWLAETPESIIPTVAQGIQYCKHHCFKCLCTVFQNNRCTDSALTVLEFRQSRGTVYIESHSEQTGPLFSIMLQKQISLTMKCLVWPPVADKQHFLQINIFHSFRSCFIPFVKSAEIVESLRGLSSLISINMAIYLIPLTNTNRQIIYYYYYYFTNGKTYRSAKPT